MAEIRFGGGLNQLDDELVNIEECIDGENFLLNADKREFIPRPGFALKGTATNALPVRGIMQLVKRDNTETTLIQAGPDVYVWDGAASFTSKTPTSSTPIKTDSVLRGTYWSLDDLLIITDVSLQSPVWEWNGTTISELSHGIAGVTDLFAKWSVVWNNRIWLFNIKTDATLNPHMLLAGEFEVRTNFDNSVTPETTSVALVSTAPFYMLAPDLKPINAVAVFYDTLLISTKDGAVFKITGHTAADYKIVPYYSGSSVAGNELMINIGNDVMYVKTGGKIETLRSTEQFGDTKADDASKWIPDEVANINSGVMTYDQKNQRVMLFTNNKLLVLDKYIWDQQQNVSPWMKWTTGMASNLDVEAAAYIKIPGTQNRSVYFGGPLGQIYDANGSSGDAGSVLVNAFRKTRLIQELDTVNEIVSGRITYRRKAAQNLQMTFEWTDEYADSINNVPLKAPVTSIGSIFWGGNNYWGEAIYWGAGGVSEERVSTVGFSAVGKGPSFFLTTRVVGTSDFTITRINTTEGT